MEQEGFLCSAPVDGDVGLGLLTAALLLARAPRRVVLDHFLRGGEKGLGADGRVHLRWA